MKNKHLKRTLVLATMALAGHMLPALAAGNAPSEETCKAGPHDPVVQGGCLFTDRTAGNCAACHEVAGATLPGNVGPPLTDISQRLPDRDKLRAQIWDATASNPRSVMPPFGKHGILSEDEIDKLVNFLLTL